jgi:hypothetical protein
VSIKIDRAANGYPAMVTKSGGAVLMTTSGGSTSGKSNKPKAIHKNPDPSLKEEEGKKSWVPWGLGDNFADIVMNLIEKSTVGRSGLQYLTKMIYGQESLTYLRKGFDDQQRQIREYIDIEDWEDIQSRTNYDMVRLGLTHDYAFFSIAYAEIIFDALKNKVYSISYQKARNVRFAPAENGRIKLAYVSANFPETTDVNCDKIPVIDPIHYPSQIDEIRADKKQFKYLLPLKWPDARRDYYSLAYWDSSRNNGIMDISISIPRYIKAIFENQASLKYHVQIAMEYWEWKYPSWGQLTADEQETIIDDFYDEIIETLTGADNAQKMIMTFYRSKTAGANTEIGEFKITPIDDKMKNDAYLPYAAAANAETLFSMLINPAETGLGSSTGSYTGGQNNGGSNIREAHLSTRSLLNADRNVLNTVFNFVKLYNGYDKNARITIMDEVLTTLDKGKGTEKKID